MSMGERPQPDSQLLWEHRKKVQVPRPRRYLPVIGLDGAGKTAFCRAMSDPERFWAPALPTDLELELRSHRTADAGTADPRLHQHVPMIVDDRLLVRNRADNAPLSVLGRVPPPSQAVLLDTSGLPSYRRLWPNFFTMADYAAGASDAPRGKIDELQPIGLIYVISAHDSLRAILSWSEMHRLWSAITRSLLLPLLIIVSKLNSDPTQDRLTAADLLKLTEDFRPTEAASRVTIMDVDLCAVDPSITGGASYALGDLRQVGSWILSAISESAL